MGKKLTTPEFIKKAQVKHGGKYLYGNVSYVNSKLKVPITCPKHGDFMQAPASHLRGDGCPTCVNVRRGSTQRKTSETFVQHAIEVHGGRYEYDKVMYRNSHENVTIGCRIHGYFSQSPGNHLNGAGCMACSKIATSRKLRFTLCQFIDKARSVHGDKYDYSHVNYQQCDVKIDILCKKHGIFSQVPSSHLQGIGCPSCSVGGFNPSGIAYVYFLLDTETHSRVKIGVSNSPDRRLQELKSKTPFSVERVDLFETPPEITLQIESLCHYHMESANLKGFDGATEWFKFDGGKIEALRSFILSFGGAAK